MKSVYILDNLETPNTIGQVAAELSGIEGLQLVSYNAPAKELTLEYAANLVDKIIVEVMNLIRRISPQAEMKNID